MKDAVLFAHPRLQGGSLSVASPAGSSYAAGSSSSVPGGGTRPKCLIIRRSRGRVVSIKYGKLKGKGDWLAAYYNARIEKLAVNSSYAQDDWVRWGSATEADSSDLKGHELRGAYAFKKNFNVVGRLYLVDAITSVQDGKRLRFDFNYKF